MTSIYHDLGSLKKLRKKIHKVTKATLSPTRTIAKHIAPNIVAKVDAPHQKILDKGIELHKSGPVGGAIYQTEELKKDTAEYNKAVEVATATQDPQAIAVAEQKLVELNSQRKRTKKAVKKAKVAAAVVAVVATVVTLGGASAVFSQAMTAAKSLGAAAAKSILTGGGIAKLLIDQGMNKVQANNAIDALATYPAPEGLTVDEQVAYSLNKQAESNPNLYAAAVTASVNETQRDDAALAVDVIENKNQFNWWPLLAAGGAFLLL